MAVVVSVVIFLTLFAGIIALDIDVHPNEVHPAGKLKQILYLYALEIYY